MSAESTLVELKDWLEHNGGYFHPQARLQQVSSGFCVVASESLPPDSKIVSCPFSLAITKDVAFNALSALLGPTADLSGWTERQLISSYISFHWIIGDDASAGKLAHLPYVKSLPSRDKLRTPLHFTETELEHLKGSNLYGATIDRAREWKAEWNACLLPISLVDREWADQLTWDLYLTAATHLSSRAFPSTLVSRNISESALTSPADPDPAPILLPGVDTLNHARAEPVSWVQSYLGTGPIPEAGSSISLVLHKAIPAGAELFNNYGAKPNAELILGYGFSLPNNPDDTIVLKIGGMGGRKWEVGRGARGAEGVWECVLETLTGGAEPTYEDHLDAAGALGEMVEGLLDKLPEPSFDDDVRDDVAEMIGNYLEGQRDILEGLILYADAKHDQGLAMAKEQGIELE
ncbi:hypothetical protein C8R46DRAFT_1269466 [Mycena filopes]|nr:hypothetical protein C8R46DRAFT_1269466 [Mycena filopes]